MLERITIKNFKAFSKCVADFSPLTLVMGENGIGKSTLTQAILLTKQNVTILHPIPTTLLLNGSLVHIGNGFDALRQNAEDERISVDLLLDGDMLSWEADYIAGIDALPLRFSCVDAIKKLHLTKVHYLSAERIGPQLIAPYSQSEASRGDVDEKGTGAFGLLHYSSDLALSADDPRVPVNASSRSIQSLLTTTWVKFPQVRLLQCKI